MEMMSINDLPTEILEKILSFVPPRDRLRSAMSCRRWAELFVAPALMRDVWLNLHYFEGIAEALVPNSTRQYCNIRLRRARLCEFNSAVWTKLGMNLRNLELKNCYWSSEVFYSILLACPNLESLVIYGSSNYIQSLELPSGMNLRNIQESTRNLRHLDLMFAMDGDVLEQVLVAMPNVSSIGLSIFDWNSDFLDRLSSLLGTSRVITKLKLYPNFITSGDMWTKLLRIWSNTLRELIANRRVRLNRQGYEALGNCTMLRRLNIAITRAIDDNLLHDILLNISQLEVLELDSSGDRVILSPEALMPILELKKLRELKLFLDVTAPSDPRVSNEFLRNLGQLSSLESLTLREGLGDVDIISFQNWANLRNLRYLEVKSLRWNANCLRTFPFKLRNLRGLRITVPESRDDEASTLPQLSESERKIIESEICSASDRLATRIQSSCLESLTMIRVPLTDVGLTCIATHHDQLRELWLSQCNNITDAGLVNLVRRESLLQILSINTCESIDGSFLEALAELCPWLRVVNLFNCAGISHLARKLFQSRRRDVDVRFTKARIEASSDKV